MKFPVVYLCLLCVVGRQVDVDAYMILSYGPGRSTDWFQVCGCEDSDQMQCCYSVPDFVHHFVFKIDHHFLGTGSTHS